ncbi:MAG: hypothetical protein ACP5HX_11620, partial [Thermoproteota archaeon]
MTRGKATPNKSKRKSPIMINKLINLWSLLLVVLKMCIPIGAEKAINIEKINPKSIDGIPKTLINGTY